MKDSDKAKAKALRNLIKAVKKTFDTKELFSAYLYTALDVLADSELFETYAYNVAAERRQKEMLMVPSSSMQKTLTRLTKLHWKRSSRQ